MSNPAQAISRRVFLRHAGAVSALGGAAAPLALNLSLLGSASAASATDYKAIVCLFMKGGNDAFNTVLATDAASWEAYAATRGQTGATIGLLPPGTAAASKAQPCSPAQLGGVLPIRPARPQGRTFALHPLLRPLQRLFDNDKRLAVVANVGPLLVPLGKTEVSRNDLLPPQLYSHNDQQSVWQAMAPEGARMGWGGLMGDVLAASNSQSLFTAVVAGGQQAWLTGDTVSPIRVTAAGAVPFGFDAGGSLYGSPAAGSALRHIGARARSINRMETDHGSVVQRSIDVHATLNAALPAASDPRWAGTGTAGTGSSLRYIDPETLTAQPNPLALQLQTVARIASAASSGSLGVRRQVFYVELGGLDTHDSQNVDHALAMAQLAHALDYFDTTLGNLGLRNNVTLFTASEFGRSFTSNGDGTDHGWGGHQFVLGGSVRGGDIYGRFPTLGRKNAGNNRFDSSPDQLQNGVLLPSQSVEQLAASLGRWMGVSSTQLSEILPRLRHFTPQDLGVMA
jgi:uncharacterized protein (DUF1501 family)